MVAKYYYKKTTGVFNLKDYLMLSDLSLNESKFIFALRSSRDTLISPIP